MRAVVFDVDGTLYHGTPVRRAMARRLALECLRNPRQGVATVRLLRGYRKAHEAIRHRTDYSDLAEAQLQIALGNSRADRNWAGEVIQRWMEVYPLDEIARHGYDGLEEFLAWAGSRKLAIGALSDYPCERKLAALGVHQRFNVVLSAQDSGVQRLKPDPRGLQLMANLLEVPLKEILYVGDREGVDDEVARQAGTQWVLIGKSHSGALRNSVSTFGELRRLCEARVSNS